MMIAQLALIVALVAAAPPAIPGKRGSGAFPAPPPAPPSAAGEAGITLIEHDTVWSGTVSVNGKLQVVSGATLTIQPGTTVQFILPSTRTDTSEDRIFVQPGGRLLARGTELQPIVFLSATAGAKWFGIELHSGHDKDELAYCRINDSRMGLACVGSSPRVEHCVFTGNEAGVSLWRQAKPVIKESSFVGNEVAIKVGMQSSPTIFSCEIAESSASGIAIEQDSGCVLERSLLRRNKVGVNKRGTGSLLVTQSRFEDNEVGAAVDREGEAELRGNLFARNRLGVRATAKSAPLVDGNAFEANDTAIRFDGRSKGSLSGNDFTGNTTAVHLSRTSSPEISRNRFSKNETAVLCEYSSYPTISENNFGGNATDIRAGDNQSFEWTRSVWPADEWERWAAGYGRNRILARNNYWGEQTTRKMQAGATPIETFFDYSRSGQIMVEDKPYRRDEIEFRPFSPEPIKGAGLGDRPAGLPPP